MKYSTIKGSFSERRRIPLLGRIRLGLKHQKVRPDKSVVEYPTETDYFVVPPEVEAVVGPQPRELTVMLPSEDVNTIFPQNLALFGSAGLKCTGNMEEAERLNEQTGEWEKRSCPCEFLKTDENPKGHCTESGTLVVILPEVSMGGTYQIRTGSYHSVVDINSGLDFVRALIGRISMVPLKLRRVARETHNDGKKQTHYTLSLTLDANIAGVNALRQDNKRVMETARLIQIEGPRPIDPENDGLPTDRVIEDGEVVQAERAPNEAALEAGKAKLAEQRGDAKPVTPAPVPTLPVAPDPPSPSQVTTDGELAVPIKQLRSTVDGEGILSRIQRNFALGDDQYPEDAETRLLYLEALWDGVTDQQRAAKGRK